MVSLLWKVKHDTLVYLPSSDQKGSLIFKRSRSWSQVPTTLLVLKELAVLDANLGLDVRPLCRWIPSQSGCGGGGCLRAIPLPEVLVEPALCQTILSAFWNVFCFISC